MEQNLKNKLFPVFSSPAVSCFASHCRTCTLITRLSQFRGPKTKINQSDCLITCRSRKIFPQWGFSGSFRRVTNLLVLTLILLVIVFIEFRPSMFYVRTSLRLFCAVKTSGRFQSCSNALASGIHATSAMIVSCTYSN